MGSFGGSIVGLAMAAETRNPEPITYSFVPRNAMNRIAGLGRISEGAVRTCRHPPGRHPRHASESIRHSFDAIQSRRQTTVVCAISNERNKLWQSGYKRKTWSVLKKIAAHKQNKSRTKSNFTASGARPSTRPLRQS
jgi:hypothetical protein